METATQTHTARARGGSLQDHLELPTSRHGTGPVPAPARAPGATRVPAAASPSRGPGPALTWRVVAGAQPHAPADAQVRHGGGQVAGAAAPAQAGVGALVRVERGGQRRGEVQVGEVGERAPRVEGRGDEGDVGRLVRGWEDAGGGDTERGAQRGITSSTILQPPSPKNPGPGLPSPALTGSQGLRRSAAGPRTRRAVKSERRSETRPGCLCPAPPARAGRGLGAGSRLRAPVSQRSPAGSRQGQGQGTRWRLPHGPPPRGEGARHPPSWCPRA